MYTNTRRSQGTQPKLIVIQKIGPDNYKLSAMLWNNSGTKKAREMQFVP
jgi:hypothetical protein